MRGFGRWRSRVRSLGWQGPRLLGVWFRVFLGFRAFGSWFRVFRVRLAGLGSRALGFEVQDLGFLGLGVLGLGVLGLGLGKV